MVILQILLIKVKIIFLVTPIEVIQACHFHLSCDIFILRKIIWFLYAELNINKGGGT